MADEMNSTCTDKAQDQTEQAVPDADTARMAEDATAEGATEADTACDAQAGAADDADENGKLRGSERRRLKRAEAELAEANKKLAKGVRMTLKAAADALRKLDVTEVETAKFDPNLHNAVMHVEDDTKGEGEIVDVFQKGYRRGDKVIRFAMVRVAN